MNTQADPLHGWLQIAVHNLPYKVQLTTREEITAHYEDAVEHYQTTGQNLHQAQRTALEDLGDPIKTRQALQRVHVSPWMQVINFIGGIDPMDNQRRKLNFWFTLGLSLLPGVIVIGSNIMNNLSGMVPKWGIVLCAVLSLIGFYRQKRFPVWTYPLIGIVMSSHYFNHLALFLPVSVAGIITGITLWRKRRRTQNAPMPRYIWLAFGVLFAIFIGTTEIQTLLIPENGRVYGWNLYCIVIMLSIIMAGIPFAKRDGIYAMLFITAISFSYGELILGYTYSIWSSPWCDFMLRQSAFWFLLVTPIWILCTRTTFGKVTGILFPSLVGLFIAALVDALVRINPALLGPLNQIILATIPDRSVYLVSIGIGLTPSNALRPLIVYRMISTIQFVSTLAFTTVLYHWLNPSAGRQMIPQQQQDIPSPLTPQADPLRIQKLKSA